MTPDRENCASTRRPADTAPLPPRLVFWETTAGCNLECVHCRRLEVSRELLKSDLTTAEGRRLIDQIAEVGRPVLVLSGGEPLMRPDIFDLAAHAKAKGLLVALATNGTMIDEAMAGRIADTGFDRVSVSLDGADADTHDRFRGQTSSFDLSMRALDYLRRAGVATQLNCTIARHNKDQIEAVLKLAERVGAVAVHYFLLVPVGCGEQIADEQMLNANEVEARLERIARLAQKTTLQIKPTCAPHYYRIIRQQGLLGTLQAGQPSADDIAYSTPKGGRPPVSTGDGSPNPVARAPGSDQDKRAGQSEPRAQASGVAQDVKHAWSSDVQDTPALHSLTKGCLAGTAVCFVSHQGEVFPCGYLPVAAGNVREWSFGDIWRNSPVFADLRDPDKLTGKCGQCEFKLVCGGCRARAFYQFGSPLAEEPACAYQPAARPTP